MQGCHGRFSPSVQRTREVPMLKRQTQMGGKGCKGCMNAKLDRQGRRQSSDSMHLLGTAYVVGILETQNEAVYMGIRVAFRFLGLRLMSLCARSLSAMGSYCSTVSFFIGHRLRFQDSYSPSTRLIPFFALECPWSLGGHESSSRYPRVPCSL